MEEDGEENRREPIDSVRMQFSAYIIFYRENTRNRQTGEPNYLKVDSRNFKIFEKIKYEIVIFTLEMKD